MALNEDAEAVEPKLILKRNSKDTATTSLDKASILLQKN